MYQSIRNQMKVKKKKGPMSQSRPSSSQKGEALQVPDLIKHKTHEPRIVNARKKQNKRQQYFFQQEESKSNKQESLKSAKNNNKNEQKNLQLSASRQRSEIISPAKIYQKQSPPKINEVNRTKQQKTMRSRRNLRASKQNLDSSLQQKQNIIVKSRQKQSDQSKEKQMESQQQQVKKKLQRPNSKGMRRNKKGRPTKQQQMERLRAKAQKQQQKQQQQQQQEQQQQVQSPKLPSKSPQRIVQHSALKRGRKRLLHSSKTIIKELQHYNLPSQVGTMTEKQLQKIRNCMKNRKQLIKILLQMPITSGNIKQILDLGVSEVLQQGPITKNVHLLLCTLKATLLHKYFPDDNKQKRKFEKMTKQKKKVIVHQDQNQNNDNNQQLHSDCKNNKMIDQAVEQKTQSKVEQKHRNASNSKKGKKHQKEQIIDKNNEKIKQIRSKASNKLQKMIRKAGFSEGSKEFAIRIQNTFQQAADMKGDLYRNVAYDRLRTIKTRLTQLSERNSTSNQIKLFLQQTLNAYEQDLQATCN